MAAGHGLARGRQGHGLARRSRAPAQPAAAGPAPGPSAGGSRRTGPAPLGTSFVYALLSKNTVNRGFLRFSKSMKCCQVLATKRLR